MFLHQTKPTENNREIRILGAKKGLESSSYSAFCIVEQGERPSLFSPLRLEPASPGSPSNATVFSGSSPCRVSVCSGGRMKSENESVFQKTVACPSSNTLLSYRTKRLPRELLALVRLHLAACEFCTAELALLAFHKPRTKGDDKPPEIPMNLRILAESLLCQSSKMRIVR